MTVLDFTAIAIQKDRDRATARYKAGEIAKDELQDILEQCDKDQRAHEDAKAKKS